MRRLSTLVEDLEYLSELVKRNAMWEVSEMDVCFTDFFHVSQWTVAVKK